MKTKQNKKIYFFIGTTTELVRIAPILKELKRRNASFKIIASGQNKIHLEHISRYIKDVKIDIILREKGNKSSAYRFLIWSIVTFITGMIVLRKEFKGLTKENSEFVIFGDPVSTSIGALVAKIYGLHIVHLESGDFSFDLREPFPEEICRNMNVMLADVLFPPSTWALENLKKKNIYKETINTYYNTQLEVFQWALEEKPSGEAKNLVKSLGKYYILIMHRQEHVFFRRDWTREILKFILENSNEKLKCIMFDHPLSKQIVDEITPRLNRKVQKNIKTLSLLSYSDFLYLLKNSEYLASDSATNQYETYLIGKPYLALREKTEQVEGLNENVVLSNGNINVIKDFLKNYKIYKRNKVVPSQRPSKIIVDYLLRN